MKVSERCILDTYLVQSYPPCGFKYSEEASNTKGSHMSASEAITKASIATTLSMLGMHEEAPLREAEGEMLKLMLEAGELPLEIELNAKFSELLEKIGEAVLSEAVERAEVLLNTLKGEGSFPKSDIVKLLTVDIADVLAMMVESFGGNPDDVYAQLAGVEDHEKRAKVAVATLAKTLLKAIQREG